MTPAVEGSNRQEGGGESATMARARPREMTVMRWSQVRSLFYSSRHRSSPRRSTLPRCTGVGVLVLAPLNARPQQWEAFRQGMREHG